MREKFASIAHWAVGKRPLRHLPRWGAIAVLAALVVALVWSSLAAPGMEKQQDHRFNTPKGVTIGDIELYQRIETRVAAGESYYVAALAEQRANGYPTTPFYTVRLPTSATLGAVLHGQAWKIVALGFLVLAGIAFQAALLPLAGRLERGIACLMPLIGGIGLFTETGRLLHESLAGMVLTLALPLFAVRRAAFAGLVFAAMALAVRELALPFVLLWGAFVLAEGRKAQAVGVAAILLLFAGGLYLHAQGVAAYRLPTDLVSPGWSEFRGFELPLLALARLTPLLFLPLGIAVPLAVLPLLGWIGLGGRLGLFAGLWFAGFALFMALFARITNVYWVLMVMPAYGVGFAFVPRALADLVLTAIRGQESQP